MFERVPRWNKPFQKFLFALLALVHAPLAAKCVGDTVTTEISLPESVSLSRDAGGSNGQVIWQSGWVGTDAANISQCESASEQRRLGYASSMTRAAPAATYATSVPGVGVQVAWVESRQASPTFGAPPSRVLAWPALSQRLPGGADHSVPARFAIRLVKTGDIVPGRLSFTAPLAVVEYGSARAAVLHVTGATQVTLRACTTPDVTVNLGTHPASALAIEGSTTPAVAFALRLSQCPPGLVGISYQFSSWEAQAEPGIIAARALQSTATGVAVRISWRDGKPLRFLQSFRGLQTEAGVPVTDVTAGGDFFVPLQASLYRMPGQALSAGEVVAELEFRLWYE